MKSVSRVALLAAILGLGVIVVVSMNFSTAAAAGDVDLTVKIDAPEHVAADTVYETRISYYNLGTYAPLDALVTATLPAETQFITATDRWGAPLPPASIDGNTLSWSFEKPHCFMPLDSCCGHVLISLRVGENVAEGTPLTTTATVGTSSVDADMSNNEATSVSLVCAMAGSTKQAQPRFAMPGDAITYTITLSRAHRNEGNEWEWARMTDTLPFSHQVRFLGWQGTVTGTIHEGNELRWEGWIHNGEAFQLQYRLGVEAVFTPGMVLTNVAMVQWQEQLMQLGPVTTVISIPHGAISLGPNEGGQVYHRHGVTLTIPPGAVTDTTAFRLGPLYTATHPTDPPGQLLFANRAFEIKANRFGDPVGHFNRPLTITMNYTDTDIVGLKRETVRLWTRTGPNGPWSQLGEPARVMSGTMVYTTTHLSEFALFGQAEYHVHLPLIMRKSRK